MINRDVVKVTMKMIQRRVDFEFFFENLKSADWVKPLTEEGIFSNPDPVIKHADNSISFPTWPPAKYLSRIAGENSDLVFRTINSVPEVNNPRIHEDFVDAFADMPVEVAVRGVDKVAEWLRGEHLMLLPQKVASLAAKFKAGGFHGESMKLARILFDVKKSERDSGNYLDSITPIVRSDWEYNKCLSIFSEGFSAKDKLELALLLVAKLEFAIRAGTPSASEEQDFTHIRRGSIENTNQNHDHNILDSLIGRIRDLGEQLVVEDNESARTLILNLLEQKFPIFLRMATHLARILGDRDVVSSLILSKKNAFGVDTWHEFSLLAKTHFSQLDASQQAEFFKMVEAYELYRTKEDEDGAEFQEENERERYRYYILVRDHLSGSSLLRHEELKKKFGEIQNSDFRNQTYSWTGPNSPKNVEELDRLSVDELVHFLKSWIPPPERFTGPEPSIAGLGLEFETLVTRKPGFFVKNIELFRLEEKTYVRALIQGLAKAKLGLSVADWQKVLYFLKWTCDKQEEEGVEDPTGRERDPYWGWARQAACRLVKASIGREDGSLPISLRSLVWEIFERSLTDPDPRPDRESRSDREVNYYQLAINSTRGEALEGAILYGFWVKRSIGIKAEGFVGAIHCPELFKALDAHLDLKIDPSKAIRSVYGRWFPYFSSLDKVWTKNRRKKIFPRESDQVEYWEAAWRGYIRYGELSLGAFDLLKLDYKRAVDLMPSLKDGDGPENVNSRLTEHLTWFYVMGKIGLNSKGLLAFYGNANQKNRNRVINLAGQITTSKKHRNLDSEKVRRVKELWQWRIAVCREKKDASQRLELAQFGWWLGTKHFAEDWLLDQTVIALKLCKHLTPDHLIMGRLIDMASRHPIRVAEVLKLIVDLNVSDYGFYVWLDKGEILLRRLLKSEARSMAVDIVHSLGARGYRQYGELLKE